MCTCCDQLWFRSSVYKGNSIKYSDKYSQGLLEECITGTKSLILLNGSALLAKPDDINNMTWQQKSHLIQNYLVICETNFEHKVQLFIEYVLKSNLMPIGEMVYLFHRVEFQQRGLPHIHALFWESSCI